MRTERLLLDTNVFLRLLLNDHPEHSRRARALFQRIAAGQVRAATTVAVVMEIVFIMERAAHMPPERIQEVLWGLLSPDMMEMSDKETVRLALAWYVQYRTPFPDALHAATANRAGHTKVCSFDRHFDRFPDIERVEP